MAGVEFTVDDSQVQALLQRAEAAVDHFIEDLAAEVAQEAASEGSRRSARLAEPWDIVGDGPDERGINAPEWWAHFLSGGTKPHGPSSKPRMVFSIDGGVVSARYVRGIPADPFMERAVETAKGRVDDIIRRSIGGLT